MRRPTPDEVRDFLEAGAKKLTRASGSRGTCVVWRISDREYGTFSALEIAEICLLTGQPLSAIATTSLTLNLARRLADLEEDLAGLKAGLKVGLEEGFTS